MKKNIVKVALFSAVLMIGQNLLAQGPPPPSEVGGHGQQGNQTTGGGGAPIGGGLGILIALGAAYGGKKVYNWNQNKQN